MALLALAACTAEPGPSAVSYDSGFQHSRAGDAEPPVRIFPRNPTIARVATAPTEPEASPPGPSAGERAPEIPAQPPAAMQSAAAMGARGPGSALTPTRLKGLSGADLRATLGDPTLLRRDGPAQLWQYAGSGCVLHVFLYDDHGTFRVTYSEVRVDDPEIANPPTCVEIKGLAKAASQAMPSSTRAAPRPATSPGGI